MAWLNLNESYRCLTEILPGVTGRQCPYDQQRPRHVEQSGPPTPQIGSLGRCLPPGGSIPDD